MKTKKILAVILAVVMMICAAPVGVLAKNDKSAQNGKKQKKNQAPVGNPTEAVTETVAEEPTEDAAEAVAEEPAETETETETETVAEDFDWAVGMSVVFPDDRDLILYKKASVSAQTQVVPAASVRYVDAQVKSWVIDAENRLWFELKYDVTAKGVPNKKCTWMPADSAVLTSDPNPVREVTATVGEKTITVVGRMPETVTLSVTELDASEYVGGLASIIAPVAAFDITLMNGTEEFEPLTPARVTITGINSTNPIRVYHLTNSDPENPTYISVQRYVYNPDDGTIDFEADGFSVYLLCE